LLLGPSEDDMDVDEGKPNERSLKEYWKSVQSRYQTKLLDPESLCSSQTKTLPSNWTIIHVHLAEDKSTLLVSRQECGESAGNPLLFCVPLKGRRDDGTGDEEEHLSFEDAMAEFAEIIRLSNAGTKAAVHVNKDDEEARSKWWKQRNDLDTRLKDLLENIEFCWLGAFKVRILLKRGSSKSNLPSFCIDDPGSAPEPYFRTNGRTAYWFRKGVPTESSSQGQKTKVSRGS
jgi:separase